MDDPDNGPPAPISELGLNKRQSEELQPPLDEHCAKKLLSNMEALLSRVVSMSQTPPATDHVTQLIQFDPDDVDADIEGWCKVTEMIIQSKKLEGVNLLLALMSALKGRSANCLTRLNLTDLTWEVVKQSLLAKFLKPRLAQDYFDDILRFQIGTKETASESAMRLWNMIERIPKTDMHEEIITGFVVSVLCQKDNVIRRELNAQVITSRVQLFRVLGGISLKRRLETDTNESEPKRPRMADIRFPGKCHRCGLSGHRQADCRKRREDFGILNQQNNPGTSRFTDRTQAAICYTCHKPGHLANVCPDRKSGEGTSVKEVNLCEQRTSRGILHTSSGIGGNDISCNTQVLSKVQIGQFCQSLLFHIVPDKCISDPVIIGRDILDKGVGVRMDNDSLTFFTKEELNSCELSSDPFFSQIDSDLLGSERKSLVNVLNKYADCFIEGVPRRRVQTGTLEINLIDPHKTVQRCPYRLSPVEKQVVREKVEELLDAKIIRESTSPFASPILLVKKKDHSDRMCVDYRKLNSNTQPEHYPLPRIEDQIDQLSGAHFFSSLDMASSFHQIPVHPDSVEKTAFVTPEGQYEYLAMPFGLRNAPSVYQRCITKALCNLKVKPLIYMDDVLCYSSNIGEGLDRLNEVLNALSTVGFSFNLKKCKFLKSRIEYLGYSIQSGEVRPNNRKIQALVDAQPPKTATQVRQFLGLASYFRRFIPGFTQIVGPLYPITKLKGPIKWNQKYEDIRNKIVTILTSEPVLAIFDPEHPVELHTDASSEGYGAVLIQKKNNLPHVIEYFSRRTSDVETRYHSYELETLAVVRAVEHFRHYLYGRRFTVFTDCNSLKASKSKTDLTPRVHRWWAFLQAYDFDIVYREGRRMEHADYLSRNPLLESEMSSASTVVNTRKSKTVQFVELHKGWLSVEQKRDSEIQDLITKHHNNDFPDTIAQTYDVREGVLFRKIVRNKITSWLPVVPRSLIWTLINHVHTELQHLGYDKTLDKLYEQYWFPQMAKNVRKFIDSCIICKASKGPSGAQAIQLHPIPKVSLPWHTIHIDFTGKLSGKSDRKEYCSVIIDAFTKYVLLEHTFSLDANSAVRALRNSVCLFGAPKRIIADQGRCYISTEFKKFCLEYKIDLHFIATGSARANGQVERVMRTLKSLLTIIENDSNKTWREELGNVQLALNSTRSSVTKYSPTELMFGIRARSLGLSRISTGDSEQKDRLDLDTVRENASENIQKAAASDSQRFNKGRATIKPFSEGDFVFLKSSERNQTKLDRKYKGPFVVVAVLENDRYELKCLNGSNAKRTYKYAHENLRSVPPGHSGLLDIASTLLNERDGETAESDYVQAGTSSKDNISLTVDDHTLTDNSDTVTVGSDTLSVGSDTISTHTDDETLQVEIHAEQGSP